MERAERTRLEYHEAKNAPIEAGFGAAELDAAFAHGSLTCDEEDNVSFDIPSFRNYMKQLLARDCSSRRSEDRSTSTGWLR